MRMQRSPDVRTAPAEGPSTKHQPEWSNTPRLSIVPSGENQDSVLLEVDLDRADDLLALSHWRRNLEWRYRILRLRFEHDLGGFDTEDEDKLAAEVVAFRAVLTSMSSEGAV